MPADVPILTGNESFLTLVDESTWGEYPVSPTLIHLPYDTYDVEFTPEVRAATPYAGTRQRQHTRWIRGMPNGQLNSNLYGWRQSGQTISLAEHLLVWGFGAPEAKFRGSKSVNHYEGLNVDNQRHRGLRVNQATLAGQEGGPITLALDLMGRHQDGNVTVSTAPAVPFDRQELIEFNFDDDVTLELDGEELPFGGFSLVSAHNLIVSYLNSKSPSSMPAGDTVETLTLNPPKTSNKWSEVVRQMDLDDQDVAAVLTLKGLHRGTGEEDTNWTQITITLDRLALTQAKTGRSRGILQQPLTFNVLKPQVSGGAGIVMEFEDIE